MHNKRLVTPLFSYDILIDIEYGFMEFIQKYNKQFGNIFDLHMLWDQSLKNLLRERESPNMIPLFLKDNNKNTDTLYKQLFKYENITDEMLPYIKYVIDNSPNLPTLSIVEVSTHMSVMRPHIWVKNIYEEERIKLALNNKIDHITFVRADELFINDINTGYTAIYVRNIEDIINLHDEHDDKNAPVKGCDLYCGDYKYNYDIIDNTNIGKMLSMINEIKMIKM